METQSDSFRLQEQSKSANRMVLIKGCLNGRTSQDEHEAVPLSAEELASEARAAVNAGAGGIHIHPRRSGGLETLAAEECGEAIKAIRNVCPGVPIGLTTAAWIEPDSKRRLSLVEGWTTKPDFASVNFGEEGASEICLALIRRDIGIEAGIWSVSDAKLYLESDLRDKCIRVLVEVVDKDPSEAVSSAARIDQVLDAGKSRIARLHHGYGLATWTVLDTALTRGHDIRVGLEDTPYLPDGKRAKNNADLVAAAARLVERHGLRPQTISGYRGVSIS